MMLSGVTTAVSQNRASDLLLAARVCAWLCWLPVRLHHQSLPALLGRMTTTGANGQRGAAVGLVPTIRIVRRVCRLRLFDAPMLPRACLREALALYHILTSHGHPVRFHIGVRKSGATFIAHSWVTIAGEPLVHGSRLEAFTPVYSYPERGAARPAHPC